MFRGFALPALRFLCLCSAIPSYRSLSRRSFVQPQNWFFPSSIFHSRSSLVAAWLRCAFAFNSDRMASKFQASIISAPLCALRGSAFNSRSFRSQFPRLGQVPLRIGIIGPEAERLLQLQNGVVGLALVQEDHAEVIMGVFVIGFKPQAGFGLAGGLVQPARVSRAAPRLTWLLTDPGRRRAHS